VKTTVGARALMLSRALEAASELDLSSSLPHPADRGMGTQGLATHQRGRDLASAEPRRTTVPAFEHPACRQLAAHSGRLDSAPDMAHRPAAVGSRPCPHPPGDGTSIAPLSATPRRGSLGHYASHP